MLCFFYLLKLPKAQRKGNHIQRKTSKQQLWKSFWRLNGWKTVYAIKDRRIAGEASDISEKTITF